MAADEWSTEIPEKETSVRDKQTTKASVGSRFAFIAILAALPLAKAAGQEFIVDSDMFGYDISVTRYGTLADAQSQTNAVSGPHTVLSANPNDPRGGMRDVWLGFYVNHPGYYHNFAGIMTAWYFTINPANGDGHDNPNNTNTGFMQLYDDFADSMTSAGGGWSTLAPGSADASTFSFFAAGGVENDPDEFPRLWAAPEVGGAGEITKGMFHEWSIAATVGGLTANHAGGGWFESTDAPGSISGAFGGIFENQSATRPDLNGFYRFHATLNMDNWAVANGATWGHGTYGPFAYFGAVPEPGTIAALGLGTAWLLRRRNKK